jgi:pimeloyl-ACP methyl ester carboxylesterase
MGSSARMWRAQAATLADRYRLVIPDLPGHAANTDRFTIDGAVEQARGLLDGAPAYVVGVSLGAVVALKLALSDPGAVAGLMVSGATVRAPRFGAAVQRAITMTMPLSLTARMSASIVKPVDVADRTTLVSDIRRAGKRTQLDALREFSLLDLRPALDRIGVPTLVCCGSRDRANLTSARVLAQTIPTATLRIIPDGGHLWNLQQPSLCTQIINEAVR